LGKTLKRETPAAGTPGWIRQRGDDPDLGGGVVVIVHVRSDDELIIDSSPPSTEVTFTLDRLFAAAAEGEGDGDARDDIRRPAVETVGQVRTRDEDRENTLAPSLC